MGAGSSTEQRSPEPPEAGSGAPAEPEPEPRGGSPVAEAAPGAPGDPDIAAAEPATKLLQKNGQLSTLNGLAEQEELTPQEGVLNGQEEEVTVPEVGQRESEDVNERGSDKEMAANSSVVQDITKDGQEEMPEIIEQIPSSESNLEELTQPAESQTNDVGFKKVFKFVGFKFTVKKDKSEKSDTVQLLTVRKEEGEGAGESEGAGDHQEPSREAGEATHKENELKQSTESPEKPLQPEQSSTEISFQAESGQAAEEGKDGEEKQEKEPTKSPDSPTSPVASETASPFKKFFTQGWAGWRKKTSFRKPKEDELEASEKKKEQETERVDAEEKEKTEDTSEKLAAAEQPQPQEATESVHDARLSAEYEKVELPSEGQGQASPEERSAPLATEIFDEKVEIVAEVHVSTAENAEEQEAEVEETEEPQPAEKLAETSAGPQEAEPPVCAPGGDHTQPPEPGPEEQALSAQPEGIVSEVEMLASQERVKVQGSPLKKLFTSTGLKKLSGKKQKAKRGGEEESGEQHAAQADSPDSPDEHKGESSASSPEEPEEITCLEKGIAEAHPDGEGEEGATSDGEKKREGVTPWASFKKMVTPKKRVRRLSESDKEEELEKAKGATLSSTESAASEMPEEGKGHGEEPKPEEPKRKVDTSVSWEALICVGSSKKRARKASSSDEEEGPKPTAGEGPKPDEAGRDREAGPEAVPAGAQEHDPGQGSSSPEQAGSPSEGEGVSTWESFKRLVTPRKKSKSKLEEKTEDPGTGAGVEHSAAEVEPGKEESWVSIKKFIPGRRKKRSDGKQDHATAEDAGPTEVNEDDADVPAVVPLSEYDAVEREKTEAQEARKREETAEPKGAVSVSEELSKSLVHTVTVAVVDGARAVTHMEERSPSWISASATGPLEQAEEEAGPPPAGVLEREGRAEDSPVVTQALPESRDAGEDTLTSEVEPTPEAVTAAEPTEAFGAEEATEASGAEETTDMVSAVSQLSESPDTTEEATPVQEAEGGEPDVEGQERRTQEVLQAVAERVREASQLDVGGPGAEIHTARKEGSQLPEVGETEEDPPVSELKEEVDMVLQGHAGETKAETLTPGDVFGQAAPEHAGEVPPVPESIPSSELRTPCQAETLVGVKSEIVLEQAVGPDSAETLTDSETSGSTPVPDCEAPPAMQQVKVMEVHAEGEGASGTKSQVMEAQAAPAPKEMPPAPSGLQSQEEKKEHSEIEGGPEHTDKEVSVEAVPILSKAEATPEAGQFADEETKDVPFIQGLEVSADTEMTAGQKKAMEVALKDEVTQEADGQKNENTEFQSPAPSLPAPGERERVVQVEREEAVAKAARVSEEKLEPKPAEVLSKQLVHTVHVTVVDGEKEVLPFEESSWLVQADRLCTDSQAEVLSKQLVHTVHVTVVDGEKEVLPFEESSPWLVQADRLCTDSQVQSSEASLPLTAAAVEKKVLGETVKLLEAAGPLESADARLEPEAKPSDQEDVMGQPGEDAAPTGPASRAESAPVVIPAAPAKGVSADLEGDKTTFQEGKSEEDCEQVSGQGDRVSEMREEGLKAEKEILQLKTESQKLVQNVIQTAVDQLVSTEGTATDCQTPAQLAKADHREAEQKIEKEERELQGSAEAEAAQEESALTTVGQTPSEISKDANAAAKEVTAFEVKGSPVNDQLPEELVLPTQEKREATGTKCVPELGDRAGLGERTENEPQEDEKRDAVHYPENQISALGDPEASGDLTKESSDANGPKLKEKEVGFQEGKGPSEPEKEIKTQTQEEAQEQERQPATPELAEP
ncbi:A-kinase anchor protein 12 isoform X2 [Myotis myotis]|uniref:A-kinase anchor protein 12 isoform X2 n=1 Tax=Myotis myotis TaxID=51298 RepID=UPI00174D9773|nr:A-kinase anchor protein 12 isoform X2 [Myotis myotis]